MKHVFVESNWVFAYVEPEYRRLPAAERLVQRAISGEITLHVPAICLREGAESVRRKCTPHHPKALGDFRRTLQRNQLLSDADSKVIERFFEQFQQVVRADLDGIDERLKQLVMKRNVKAFALSEAMLERVLALREVNEVSQMKPFDEAILAAVIVQAAVLRDGGATDVTFCTQDSDLWPFNKKGEDRGELKRLYQESGLTVLNDFDVP